MTAASATTGHRNRKLAIIGAGSVGATFAYACLIRGSCDEIVLIDINHTKRDAQAKDLQHGLAYCPPASVRAGEVADCADAQIIAITAGAKSRPGETRLDLADRNVTLLRQLMPELISVAPQATFLLVTNPVDVLTYAATRLGGLPRSRVIGSGTVLDSARFRQLIAERLRVAPRDVRGYIVGEHGDSEIPLWSSASIAGIPIDRWALLEHGRLDEAERERITGRVRTAASEIIAGKGATNFAVGLCCARIVEALFDDVPQVLPVAACIEESDGVEGVSDVALSLPRLVSRLNAEPPLPVPMNDEELAGLRKSASVLHEAQRRTNL